MTKYTLQIVVDENGKVQLGEPSGGFDQAKAPNMSSLVLATRQYRDILNGDILPNLGNSDRKDISEQYALLEKGLKGAINAFSHGFPPNSKLELSVSVPKE